MKLVRTLNLLKNRRGVSAVISNLILIAAVIAVGLTVLVWSQTQSSNYNNLYGNAIKSDTDQLRERVTFEYIHYDPAGNLTVYLMNSGTIGNITIANVYIDNTACGAQSLHLLNGTSTNSLNATKEGYFVVSIPSLSSALGNNHPITIITGRGSSFVATFAT
jgi:hypothetical protein